MDKDNVTLKKWDTFYGPDPLEGRVNVLIPLYSQNSLALAIPAQQSKSLVPYTSAAVTHQSPTPYFITPVTTTATRSIINFQQYIVRLQQMIHVKMPYRPPPGFTQRVSQKPLQQFNPDVFCAFCRTCGEDKRQYMSHSTSSCLILKNCVCDHCGGKGHTNSHCRLNSSGSVFQRLRQSDQVDVKYDSERLSLV